MKLFFSLLTLCAAPSATAFTVQTPSSRTASTQLHSDPSYLDRVVTGANEGAESPFAPQTPAGAMVSADRAKKKLDEIGEDNLIKVQGNSLRTWAFQTESIQRVQILMKTEGRPLNAQVDLWEGPDNTPQKMTVYCEDAEMRPFSAIVETPGSQNAVAVYNTATMEYPLHATVVAETDMTSAGLAGTLGAAVQSGPPQIIQGGAVKTQPFPGSVNAVQVLLRTDGRPMNARIELLQGPNNLKQVLEVYTESGTERPLFIVLETPGTGNVVRIVNTATLEYPIVATIEPYAIDPAMQEEDPASFFIVD